MNAVGSTEGGFPYGLTVDAFRAENARQERGAAWAVAKRALASALETASPGSRAEVGWVRKEGEGLSRGAWAAEVDLRPDPDELSGVWVALVPEAADPRLSERVSREVELLRWLRAQAFPFRLPRVAGSVGDVLVREWVDGVPLEMRAGRQGSVRPWEVVAEVARAVHALAPPDWLSGFATRREHALAQLSVLERLGDPVADDAREWALQNLPPSEPAALLHGDLLGQNVIFHFELPPAVIDWEYASVGDPALDLAIVTRGVRQPFKLPDGLERLLEAYTAAGGRDVRAEHVRIHELSMLAGWAVAERDDPGGTESLQRFRGLARRVIG